jgi:hypothetical protein
LIAAFKAWFLLRQLPRYSNLIPPTLLQEYAESHATKHIPCVPNTFMLGINCAIGHCQHADPQTKNIIIIFSECMNEGNASIYSLN